MMTNLVLQLLHPPFLKLKSRFDNVALTFNQLNILPDAIACDRKISPVSLTAFYIDGKKM
jgi:hypothetical protein